MNDQRATDTRAPTWAVVTVTFNNAAELNRYWQDCDFGGAQWIVVDNASVDGSADIAGLMGAQVIRSPDNVGFARANNLGLRAANSELVAFVNPDVRVDLEGLAVLKGTLERIDALVAPQLVNEDGSYQANGRGLPFVVDKLAHRGLVLPGARRDAYLLGEADPLGGADRDALVFTAWVMGAVVCARRSTLEMLGGWSESYFLYYEDHDLGLRSWRAGVPVVIDRKVRWVHGWKRETSRATLGPWRREIASARVFLTQYPEFILPTRRWAARRHPAAHKKVFQAVDRAEGAR